jgi:hypothetical protein
MIRINIRSTYVLAWGDEQGKELYVNGSAKLGDRKPGNGS